MSVSKHRRNTYQYRRARRAMLAQAAAENWSCHRCGLPIDYTLPYRDPNTGRVNKGSATADHIHRVIHGGTEDTGNPADLAPAHQRCNSSDGATQGNKARPVRFPVRAAGSGPLQDPPFSPRNGNGSRIRSSD